jgi:hypothetical protein
VFGKIPLSSWGDVDESNRLVRRRKKRPSKEAVALAVPDEVSLVDDEVVDDEVVDDEVDDDADVVDDVGSDGEKSLEFLSAKKSKKNINVLDPLELDDTFWKLPWTK